MVLTKDCTKVGTGLVPMVDLLSGTYAGFTGGHYGNGQNDRPSMFDEVVRTATASIAPKSNGKIDGVFIGDDLGNSIATGAARVPEWAATLRSDVRITNCSNAAQHLEQWACMSGNAPGDGTWTNGVVTKLTNLGRSPADIQFGLFAAMASLGSYFTLTSPEDRIEYFILRMKNVMRKAKQYLPNIKMISVFGGHEYLGYYGGEPQGYDGDFGMQQSILQQDSTMALTFWGRSSWADGLTPRTYDGLAWPCDCFGPGGHLADGIGNVHLIRSVVLPWLQSDPAVAGLRR